MTKNVFEREMLSNNNTGDRSVSDPEIIEKNIIERNKGSVIVMPNGAEFPVRNLPRNIYRGLLQQGGRLRIDISGIGSSTQGGIKVNEDPSNLYRSMYPDMGGGRKMNQIPQTLGAQNFSNIKPDLYTPRVSTPISQGGSSDYSGIKPDLYTPRVSTPISQGGPFDYSGIKPNLNTSRADVKTSTEMPQLSSGIVSVPTTVVARSYNQNNVPPNANNGVTLDSIEVVGEDLPQEPRKGFPLGILALIQSQRKEQQKPSSKEIARELLELQRQMMEQPQIPVYRNEGTPEEGERSFSRFFNPNFYLQKLTGPEARDFLSDIFDRDSEYARDRAKNIKRAAAQKIKSSYEQRFGTNAINYDEYNQAVQNLKDDSFDTSDFTEKQNEDMVSLIPGQRIEFDENAVPSFVPKKQFNLNEKTDPTNILNTQRAKDVSEEIDTEENVSEENVSEENVSEKNKQRSTLIGANLIKDKDTGTGTDKDFGTRVQEKIELYEQFLGSDPNERKANALFVLAQAAANVAAAAGKTPKFSTAVAQGLQTLPLGLAKAAATDKKQDRAIKLAAIEGVEAADIAKSKSLRDLSNKLLTAQLKNLGTDAVKAQKIAVQIGQIAKENVNPFTLPSVKSYMPLLVKEGYIAEGGLPGDKVVANDILGLPVGTFVSVSKQRAVNKEAINSVYAGESFKQYADAYTQFVNEKISKSELDAIADKNAFGPKVGVNVTTNEKRVLDKKDVIEKNYKVIRKIDKIIKEFKDTYGPSNAFSRALSKLTVPFIGDQESFIADAKKIAAEKNFPQFRKFIRRIDDAGGMRLKAEYKLEEKEFKDLEPGFFSSVEVAIDGMLDRRNDAANNIIEASAEIDPQFNQVARYIKRTAKGNKNDPFAITDLQHPEVRTTIEQAKLFDKIFYYKLPDGKTQTLTGQQILNIK